MLMIFFFIVVECWRTTISFYKTVLFVQISSQSIDHSPW
jgi:hypothetical protein